MNPAASQPGTPNRPPVPATHLAWAWRAAASLCIKCGFCLPACPTYRETGLESASPRGRLELMYQAAQGNLALADIRAELSLCLGCLACETACPSGIRYRGMLDAARSDDAALRRRHEGQPLLRRLALGPLLRTPWLLRAVAWGLYALQRSGLRRVLGGHGLLRLVAPGLARMERGAPPIPAPLGWRARARRFLAPAGAPTPVAGKAAAILTGCVMDAVFGQVHLATAKVLHANGHGVQVPAGQTCCGALHHHAGDEDAARALARQNIAAFEAVGDAAVIVNAAGCGALMKEYGALLADDPDWASRAQAFSARVQDVCEFLVAHPLRAGTRPVPLKVAYDDPCHLLHAQRIGQPPRQVLAAVPGLELVPLKEADWCCGSAGSYALTQPEMSTRLLERKVAHLRASGAQVVASGNPGCLLHLRRGLAAAGLPLRVVHPVELLADSYE